MNDLTFKIVVVDTCSQGVTSFRCHPQRCWIHATRLICHCDAAGPYLGRLCGVGFRKVQSSDGGWLPDEFSPDTISGRRNIVATLTNGIDLAATLDVCSAGIQRRTSHSSLLTLVSEWLASGV